ncbi:MAG: hypothetical protein IPN69_08110 [Acidobacteria bacterium]|nr:hypothetical protein [Acidobacteriota bacterium]
MAVEALERAFPDIDLVQRRVEVTNAALTTMHGALCEIVRCEPGLRGSIAMRSIAESALVQMQQIAAEVTNA